jgi:hypothetical protein
MILTYPYPRSEGIPYPLHQLRNRRTFLEGNKKPLVTINKALVDPEFLIIINKGGEFRQAWEEEAWKEWEAKSAEEKRPLIDKICNNEVERVSVISTTVSTKLELEGRWLTSFIPDRSSVI